MRIILASQSPRRKFLLEKMGLVFDIIPSDFEEYVNSKITMNELVEELGLGKVMEVAEKYPDAIVIGGDSMVTIDGKQLGKPRDADDVRKMLRNYSDRSHEVVTSVAVVCLDKDYKKVASDTTTITFDTLTYEFIDEYIATKTMFDKAGSYAVQHPLVREHVADIDGHLDTVIGMSTHLVAQYLNELGIKASPADVSWAELLEEKGLQE